MIEVEGYVLIFLLLQDVIVLGIYRIQFNMIFQFALTAYINSLGKLNTDKVTDKIMLDCILSIIFL